MERVEAAAILLYYHNREQTVEGLEKAAELLPFKVTSIIISEVEAAEKYSWADTFDYVECIIEDIRNKLWPHMPLPQTDAPVELANQLWYISHYACSLDIALRNYCGRDMHSSHGITVEEVIVAVLGHRVGEAVIGGYVNSLHKLPSRFDIIRPVLNSIFGPGIAEHGHRLHTTPHIYNVEGVVANGLMRPTREEVYTSGVSVWAWVIANEGELRGSSDTTFRVYRSPIFINYDEPVDSLSFLCMGRDWENVPFKWLVDNAHEASTFYCAPNGGDSTLVVSISSYLLTGPTDPARYKLNTAVAGVTRASVDKQLESGRVICAT